MLCGGSSGSGVGGSSSSSSSGSNSRGFVLLSRVSATPESKSAISVIGDQQFETWIIDGHDYRNSGIATFGVFSLVEFLSLVRSLFLDGGVNNDSNSSAGVEEPDDCDDINLQVSKIVGGCVRFLVIRRRRRCRRMSSENSSMDGGGGGFVIPDTSVGGRIPKRVAFVCLFCCRRKEEI